MKYTEEYQIEFKDCDENRRLKLPALLDLIDAQKPASLTCTS